MFFNFSYPLQTSDDIFIQIFLKELFYPAAFVPRVGGRAGGRADKPR